MSTDPTPLHQDASTPASLRQALHEARGGDIPPELLARLLEQAALPPPPPPPPPSAAWLPWLKWILPIASVGLLGLGLWLRRPPPPPTTAQLTTPASAPSAPPAASSAPAPADDPANPEATPPSAPSAPPPPSAHPSARAPDEATLLEQARAALASSPARTLALTREHARRFPRGLLAQEREVLAVEALRRVGKPGEATSRGDAFRMENPDSAYVPRVTASSQTR